MKKRKKGIVLGLVAVFLLLLVFGGVELYRYNTLSYYIGVSTRADGKVTFPALTYSANTEFGASEKALKRGQTISKEWTEKIFQRVSELSASYEDYTLDFTMRIIDGKTEVHLFGEGIPVGETEKRKIDELILVNYAFKLKEAVIY